MHVVNDEEEEEEAYEVDGGGAVGGQVALEALGREVPVDRLAHLLHCAPVHVLLEPVVRVPADQPPDVALAVQLLVVRLRCARRWRSQSQSRSPSQSQSTRRALIVNGAAAAEAHLAHDLARHLVVEEADDDARVELLELADRVAHVVREGHGLRDLDAHLARLLREVLERLQHRAEASTSGE